MMDGPSLVPTMDGINVMLDCAVWCVCTDFVFSGLHSSLLQSLRQLVVYDNMHVVHHYSSVLYYTNYDLLHHELSHTRDASDRFDSITAIDT